MWYTNNNDVDVYFSNAHGATIRLVPGQRVQMGKSFIESALKANVLVEPDNGQVATPGKSEADIRAEVEAKVRAEIEAKVRAEMGAAAKDTPSDNPSIPTVTEQPDLPGVEPALVVTPVVAPATATAKSASARNRH